MSMTQVALLNRTEIPSKEYLQKHIQSLGYDFKFTDANEGFYGNHDLSCSINGHATTFEIYFEASKAILKDWTWLSPLSTNPDTIIFFVWGADFAAAACIGLICIALIDLSKAHIYYLDDELTYTREMLVKDTPHFIYELEKLAPNYSDNDEEKSIDSFRKYTWWQKLLKWFR